MWVSEGKKRVEGPRQKRRRVEGARQKKGKSAFLKKHVYKCIETVNMIL